ncbi:hypothetical protein PT974_07447 [Cladobotryum mycophilum]|uniref:Ribosome biogenesis protein Alb1 n=1 Tax=Cladobotryum mycophilum TaxID=491253 RepID=A0ABR0SQ29_9HYPO
MAPKSKIAPSKHSRAARRATSPSINTDKSLKNVSLPAREPTARPSVLAAHHSAGISKKSKRGRKSQLSAKARKRQEKGLEMAEAILGRTAKKVEKSIGRARSVQQRSKAWDAINKLAVEASEMERLVKEDEEEAWTDEEMDVNEKAASEAQPTATVAAMDDDEEIL